MSELPSPLAQEVARLPRHWNIRPSRLLDQVVLEATVRSVPITLYLDLDTYPNESPRLELHPEWNSRLADRDRRLRGLVALERWNRTLGIGDLLRELEQHFREEPPRHSRPKVPSRFQRCKVWLAALVGRKALPGGRSKPDEIRTRYEELIQEKADRLLRYQQVVNNLVDQLASKKTRLTELSRQVEAQEQHRATALASSREAVAAMERQGRSAAEVRHAPSYLEGLAAFQVATSTLEETRQEAREIEEESSRLHDLVTTHQRRLEALQEDLEELREEAAEKVAELAATQVETEIRDVLSDLSPHSFKEELAELRQQVEEIERSGRVAKELAQLEVSAQGREFLASGEATSSKAAFDVLLGLSAAVDEVAGGERSRMDGVTGTE